MGTHGEGELCTTVLYEPQTVTKAPKDEVSPTIGEHPRHFATRLMPEAALVPIVPRLLTQKMGVPEGPSASSCLTSPSQRAWRHSRYAAAIACHQGGTLWSPGPLVPLFPRESWA